MSVCVIGQNSKTNGGRYLLGLSIVVGEILRDLAVVDGYLAILGVL